MKNLKIMALILIFFSLVNNVFASELKATTTLKWYDLYKSRVKNFCVEFKNPKHLEKQVELIYAINENYKKLEKISEEEIDKVFLQYRNIMDSIYTCATSITAKRQFNLIKNKLIKQSPDLRVKLEKLINSKIKNLEKKAKWLKWKCKIWKNNDDAQIKKAILNQTSYELCRYIYYLEYIKEEKKNKLNFKKNKSIIKISDDILKTENKITNEIENAYSTSSLAFKAYSDYEDNLWAHILLELIRQDFEEYRLLLHKTLNPINQVVYKISNAMKK